MFKFEMRAFSTDGPTPMEAFLLATWAPTWSTPKERTVELNASEVTELVDAEASGFHHLSEFEIVLGASRALTIEEIAKAIQLWWRWWAKGELNLQDSDGMFTVHGSPILDVAFLRETDPEVLTAWVNDPEIRVVMDKEICGDDVLWFMVGVDDRDPTPEEREAWFEN